MTKSFTLSQSRTIAVLSVQLPLNALDLNSAHQFNCPRSPTKGDGKATGLPERWWVSCLYAIRAAGCEAPVLWGARPNAECDLLRLRCP
jgi:hypothetical protein